jgi:hypothetical protein
VPTSFTPSRNVTEGDTIAAGETGSFHQVTGSLRISGTLFLNGVEVTGGGLVTTYSNPGDNRVLTSVDASTINGEANLIFDGAALTVTGDVTASAFNSANSGYSVGPAGADLQIFHSPAFGGTNVIKNFDGTLMIENESTNDNVFVRLGSTNDNTAFQTRDSSNNVIFEVAANAHTTVTTLTASLVWAPSGSDNGLWVEGSSPNKPAAIIYSEGIRLFESASLVTNNRAVIIGPLFEGEGHASGCITINVGDVESEVPSGIRIMAPEEEEPVVQMGGTGLTIGPETSGEESLGAALNINMSGIFNPEIRFDLGGGGGEVVYFGTGSTIGGALYYLKNDGGWSFADASTTGTGHNQLLGIAMSASMPSDGMLIRGFYNALDFYTGSFIKGGPTYISTTSGSMSGAAPATSNNYVRVVGYGTASGSLVYFNPDATYIEIA